MKNVNKSIMKSASFAAFVTFMVLTALLAAALGACKSPIEETTGTITISLGSAANGSNADGNARSAAWPPDETTKGKLVHKIILTGPGATQTHEINGGNTAFAFTVVPGDWTVTVEARLDGELYAKGSSTVSIKAGQNERVTIEMKHAGYTITMTSNDDNQGTATANPPQAGKGDKVTITAVSKTGYKFKEWDVTGLILSADDKKTNPLEFTMPDSAVSIKAVFEKLPENTPYLNLSAVTFTAVEYGYTQPAAQTITITNAGDVDAVVSDITLSGSSPGSFTLSGSNITSVAKNGGTATFTVQPKAGLAAGTYEAEITVTYSGGEVTDETAKADLSFTVNAVTLQSITVTTPPTKTTYTVGETFNPAGMVVTAHYSDGSTAPVTGYTPSPTTAFTTTGSHTITITFEGKTATVTVTVNETYTGPTGSGTQANPFIVHDVATLQKVGTETTSGGWTMSAHYRQVRDITLTNAWTRGIGYHNSLAGTATKFTGVYDGGGYRIENLSFTSTAENYYGSYVGLFYVGAGATVKNINLSINQNGGTYVGGIAGKNEGTITNCSVTGTISGNDVGGIVGVNEGTITNCYVRATVTAGDGVAGGIASSGGTVTNCYFTGDVSGDTTNGVGGVVGGSGTMSYCYATGSVKNERIFTGGVSGKGTVIENCVALNNSVSIKTNSSTAIGRVIGQAQTGGTQSNNYGWSDMVITYNDGGNIYNPTSSTATLTGRDGQTITRETWEDKAWWSNNAGFDFSETGPWEWNPITKLPILKNVGGEQNHTVDD